MNKKEILLLKISGLITLIGLLIIFVVYDKPLISKQAITQNQNESASLSGTIRTLKETPTVIIITLENAPNITIIASRNPDLKLDPGKFIEVKGKLENSPEGLQLKAQTIRVS